MNLVKTSTALALVAAFTAPAMAADEINFYGKANVTIQMSDDGEGSFSEVKSNASRLGVTGGLKINDALSVVYKAEFQVDMDGDSDDNITARNQYIGLKGNFGTVLLGKNDTVTKQSQGKVDIFSDLEADIKVLWKGENRMSDTLTYFTPKFGLFQAGLTYSAEGDEQSDAGISAAVTYGDAKLKSNNFYAAVAIDSEVKGYDIFRATVATKFAGIKFGAMLQTQEDVESGKELEGLMVSAAYKIDGFTLKGQVQTAEVDGGDDKSGISAGVDYSLAKNAKIFAFYTSFDMDTGADQDYLATGIEYKF
ncbi:porin [Thalassotalea sp. 42_200_T64]|nr:porin [Thalassotalea sp. 42_200_T64]